MIAPNSRRARVAPASFWARGALLVALRPGLWPTAARQARRLARPQWWRRPPFLPVPDREYLRFRFETQYGTDQAAAGPERGTAGVRPDPRDLVTYLEWCREMPELRRRRPRARR